MGFFCDYSGQSWYSYGQILIDDFYMNWLFDPSAPANPRKNGLVARGALGVPHRKIRLHHAGATAYTFESFGSNNYDPMYGYAYYPADSFISGALTLPIENRGQHGGLPAWGK
jgi:hypothetical protein